MNDRRLRQRPPCNNQRIFGALCCSLNAASAAQTAVATVVDLHRFIVASIGIEILGGVLSVGK